MQRILIITEDAAPVAAWKGDLIAAGYPVNVSGGGEEELAGALLPRPPDIFLLDGGSCRVLPRELRSLLAGQLPTHECRLIWLATPQMLAELDPTSGLDDFVVLPTTAAELLARVRLLLWRTHRIDGADLLVTGDLVLDQANYTVSAGGQQLELTYKEYELLRFLMSHSGRVFTREALLNQVWGYDYFGGTRTVDVHIRRIRAKLGPEREDLVETVRNVGYKFNAP